MEIVEVFEKLIIFEKIWVIMIIVEILEVDEIKFLCFK